MNRLLLLLSIVFLILGSTAYGQSGSDSTALADESTPFEVEDVVITGTLKPVRLSQSPVKVEVISAKFLQQQMPVTNLMEGIALINGLQEVNACGVCYTNSISINGLPGAYTAVLIDGMPMFGNLASVYGLNGLPVTIIDRIEVIKGPNSTLYGSEAMAGVVNVITKSPALQAPVALDMMLTTHGEVFTNANVTSRLGKGYFLLGLNSAYMNRFEDDNADGMGDLPAMDRWSFFGKYTRGLSHNRNLSISGRIFYEDRRNGVEGFVRDRSYRQLRGSEDLYGESIFTRRGELFGSWELGSRLRWDYSASWHDQDSYYGSDHYVASQGILFSNLIWNPNWKNHDIVAGLTARFQYYDDNTVATADSVNGMWLNQPERQAIPGIFVQDEWALGKKVTLLLGGRLDHYQAHGAIPSPRISFKYRVSPFTTLRGNMGTGFRIVNLFTEDHAFVTGQREVIIAEKLNPERSITTTANLHHLYQLSGLGEGSLDLDGHFTHFTNKINPDYDTPGKIIYANSPGFTRSRGISGQWDHAFSEVLRMNVGMTWLRVEETEWDEQGRQSTTPVPFAPNWSGVATASYQLLRHGLTFAYTSQLTGAMALPEVYDVDEAGDLLLHPRSQRSRPFAQHHLRMSKRWERSGVECYGGVTNLLDFRQPITPLSGFNDPNFATGFSPWFDTAYSYAPIHGREWFVGIKWAFNRS